MARRGISVDAKRLHRKLKYIMKKGLKVDLAKQINESAHIVIKDIKEGVIQGQDINEQAFEPLHPKTITMKKRRGMPFPSMLLVGTSAMTGALGGTGKGAYLKKRATQTRPVAQISAPLTKAPYSIYHQTGATIPVTPKSRAYLRSQGFPLKASTTQLKIPQRKWFGVSATAERQILKNLKAFITRMTRRA